MLRGTIVIFTALLAITVRKQKLPPYQWLGVTIVFVAEVIVGTAAFFQPHGADTLKKVSAVKSVMSLL